MLNEIIKMIEFKALISSGFGSLFGALAAFYLNGLRDARRDKIKNTATLKRANYLIEKVKNNNEQVKKNIQEWLKIDGRIFEWEKIGKYDSFFPVPKLELEEIMSFSEKNSLLVDNILLVYFDNLNLTRIFERRNEYYDTYLERIQHKKNATMADISEYPYKSPKEIEDTIGKKLIHELETYTNELKKINDRLSQECDTAIKTIEEYLLKR